MSANADDDRVQLIKEQEAFTELVVDGKAESKSMSPHVLLNYLVVNNKSS